MTGGAACPRGGASFLGGDDVKGMRTVVYLLCAAAFVAGASELNRFLFGSPEVFENHGEAFGPIGRTSPCAKQPSTPSRRLFRRRSGFVVESDCRTQSNNLGLLREQDVTSGTRVTVVPGNSFTAGQGGSREGAGTRKSRASRSRR
jgi:hypothetical protein